MRTMQSLWCPIVHASNTPPTLTFIANKMPKYFFVHIHTVTDDDTVEVVVLRIDVNVPVVIAGE